MTTAVSNDQKQKWNEAVTEFAQEIHRQYHGLDDSWTTALVEEVKALGLAAEYISKRSLMAAFRNCVGDKRIILPKSEPVLTQETIDKIRASFPPVVKYVPKEVSQKEKSALAGIARQTGRVSRGGEMQQRNAEIDDKYAAERKFRETQRLNSEYRKAIIDAELLTGRSHAESYSLRKEAIAAVKADPRFKNIVK